VDGDVQDALQEMVIATMGAMDTLSSHRPRYKPSEKYESHDYTYLPLDDDLAREVRQLYQANNLAVDANALSEPSKIFCYFARMTDGQARRLTALRRAAQFKGVLKSRLIRFVTDALKIIEDNVFKLDSSFDMVIDGAKVHVLSPSGFEFLGKLQEEVLAAAPENIKAIQSDLPFVDFGSIQNYAVKHSRAARHLASIRAQKETKNIVATALKRLCKDTGVEVYETKGKISVQDGHVMGFLEVLDRRRYKLELVKDSPESYRAPSRRKLPNKGGK